MDYSEIQRILRCEMGCNEKSYNGNMSLRIDLTDNQFNKKKKNITEFLTINREPTRLKNENQERRILIYYTAVKEKIYMQFPGKESNYKYIEELANGMNPFDFRPELILKNGVRVEKLSIENVIRYLNEYFLNLVRKYNEAQAKTVFKVISAYLCRMCLLENYKQRENNRFESVFDFYQDGKIIRSEKAEYIQLNPYLLDCEQTRAIFGNFDRILLPEQNSVNRIEISIEGLLYYLDIFAQQEDCKYEYLYNYGPREKDKRVVGIGRINFLLTIVNAIGCIQNGRNFERIIVNSEKGVDPVKLDLIGEITGNIVYENKKQNPEYEYIIKNMSGLFPPRKSKEL